MESLLLTVGCGHVVPISSSWIVIGLPDLTDRSLAGISKYYRGRDVGLTDPDYTPTTKPAGDDSDLLH